MNIKYIQQIRKIKKPLCLALLCTTAFSVNGQNTTTIPLPEEVRHGELPNGMQYFILKNEEPKNKVSFYFAQQVGAILEEDDEDGLAHFLEHMAFNGSENFKGRGMTQYLESKGLLFGRDVNAYTDVDETLYNIDDADSNDEELVDKCLLILHDWSGYLLLRDEEIDNERGVIEEEWRSRRVPNMRLLEKTLPALYANSKYAERDIIGDKEFIQTFQYESLRNFYKKWYRPDLQGVIIVGDIDLDAMEQKVKNVFSEIPIPENAQNRTYYKIPQNTETTYLLATDPEAVETTIQWGIKEKKAQVIDSAYLRNGMVNQFFSNMLNTRLGEVLRKPDAKGVYCYANYANMNHSSQMLSLQVVPKEGIELGAFEEAYTEIAKVIRYGFTETELERMKQEVLVQAERAIENEVKMTNRNWASLLSYYFLQANPVMKAKDYYDFLSQMLPTIKVDEVSKLAQKFLQIEKSMFIVTAKEMEGAVYPTKAGLLRVLEKVNAKEVNAYVDMVDDAPLVVEDLPVVPVKGTFEVTSMPASKGYVLENGVNVILMPSQKDVDEIALLGFSKGGYSKVAQTDLPSAKFATDLVFSSGLGTFDVTALDKKLTGKVASVSMEIDEYGEYTVGSSNNSDFETLLQLLYLNFTAPRFDAALFASNLENSKAALARSKENTATVYSDSLELAMNGYHPRKPIFTDTYLNKVDFSTAKRIFKERFANANDFTFIFTGNFENDKVLVPIQKYLGNLPFDKNGQENWTDLNFGPKAGETKVHFKRAMSNPQSSIAYRLSFPKEYNQKDEACMKLIANILSTRYHDTIREEEGGSYGVAVYAETQNKPDPGYSVTVQFNCNPDKDTELVQIVKDEISSLAEKGPSVGYLEKAKLNIIKDRRQAMDEDSFWIQTVVNELLYDLQPMNMEYYESLLATITVNEIQQFVNDHLRYADRVEVVMGPKSMYAKSKVP